MKIIHIITSLSTGGAETMLFKLLSGMNGGYHQAIVVSLLDKGTIGPRIETLGIPVYSLNMRGAIQVPKALLKLVTIVRRERPSIIQGWMYHGNLAALYARVFAKGKISTVWNIRGSHTDLKKEQKATAALIRLGGLLSSLPAVIVNNSRSSADEHSKVLGYRENRWRIIPNGFDTELYAPSSEARKRIRDELDIPVGRIIIGLFARYHPMKDHTSFFRAAQRVLAHGFEAHFLLVGRNVDCENSTIVASLRALGIENRVSLLGERSDMPALGSALDIGCSASAYGEGFSNTIGEAMSCGVPCVVTDVGDSAWVVGDSGIIVVPDNSEALADGLCSLLLLSDSERQLKGKIARQRVIDKFSLSAVVQLYEELYECLSDK